jgi:hypothetical protein
MKEHVLSQNSDKFTSPSRSSKELESGLHPFSSPTSSHSRLGQNNHGQGHIVGRRRNLYCTIFTAFFCTVGLLYSVNSTPASSLLRYHNKTASGLASEAPYSSSARPSSLVIEKQQPIPVPSASCPEGAACFWKAPYLSPSDLLANPGLVKHSNRSSVPKLLHQSWGEKPINARVKAWSDKCRMLHPDWQWVPWKNKDNRELVQKHYPWFLASYDALDTDIKRADAARNLYMHSFGGVYMDFDVECIRPFDSLFESKQDRDRPEPSTMNGQNMAAYFGRMGDDANFEHSIPNDWMASSAHHPFFLLPLDLILLQANEHATLGPEAETGPVALRKQILLYKKEYQDRQTHLDGYLSLLHIDYKPAYPAETRTATVQVLEKHFIHPFHWADQGPRDVCLGFTTSFDSEECKEVLQVVGKGSFAIAYWTHSWGL